MTEMTTRDEAPDGGKERRGGCTMTELQPRSQVTEVRSLAWEKELTATAEKCDHVQLCAECGDEICPECDRLRYDDGELFCADCRPERDWEDEPAHSDCDGNLDRCMELCGACKEMESACSPCKENNIDPLLA